MTTDFIIQVFLQLECCILKTLHYCGFNPLCLGFPPLISSLWIGLKKTNGAHKYIFHFLFWKQFARKAIRHLLGIKLFCITGIISNYIEATVQMISKPAITSGSDDISFIHPLVLLLLLLSHIWLKYCGRYKKNYLNPSLRYLLNTDTKHTTDAELCWGNLKVLIAGCLDPEEAPCITFYCRKFEPRFHFIQQKLFWHI